MPAYSSLHILIAEGNAYLVKPFSVDALKRKMETVFGPFE